MQRWEDRRWECDVGCHEQDVRKKSRRRKRWDKHPARSGEKGDMIGERLGEEKCRRWRQAGVVGEKRHEEPDGGGSQ